MAGPIWSDNANWKPNGQNLIQNGDIVQISVGAPTTRYNGVLPNGLPNGLSIELQLNTKGGSIVFNDTNLLKLQGKSAIANGTIMGNNDTVEVASGILTWTGGQFKGDDGSQAGTGRLTLQVDKGAKLIINPGANNNAFLTNTTLIVQPGGVVDWDSGNIDLSGSSRIVNNGTFNANSGGKIAGSSKGNFSNNQNASLVVTKDATVDISAANAGTITVKAGYLDFDMGMTNNTGAFQVAANAVLGFTNQTLAANITYAFMAGVSFAGIDGAGGSIYFGSAPGKPPAQKNAGNSATAPGSISVTLLTAVTIPAAISKTYIVNAVVNNTDPLTIEGVSTWT